MSSRPCPTISPINLKIYRRTRVLGNRLRLSQVRFLQALPRDTLNQHQSFPTLVAKMTSLAETALLTVKHIRAQGSGLAKRQQWLFLQGSLATTPGPLPAQLLVLPLSSDPPRPSSSPWVPVCSWCFQPLPGSFMD